MLDAPGKIDTCRGGPGEGGVTVSVGKKSLDCPDYVWWDPDMIKKGENDFMITAVKCFGEIVESILLLQV